MSRIGITKKIGDWIPKKEVMDFLGYKSTQMWTFMQTYENELDITRIGRRTFISEKSLLRILEDHKTH